MASIYQNSYITLAATSSMNNESGCFGDPDNSYEKSFEAAPNDLSDRRTMKHWERLWASNSAAVFPLLSRAWVFQECLLAPRIVHFSQNELVWECTELGDCQCGGYFVPSNPKSRDWTSKDSWRSAVELFTTLHLTFEQDRLPAFFGFADFYARSVGASLQRDYLAGLWRDSLHIDLLWRIDSSAQALETQMNRICCCLDGTYSSDENWRCQYSYPSACSLTCFKQRKLCGYDQSSDFKRSCPEQVEGSNSIHALQILRWEEPDNLRTENDPYLGPSWSWASCRSRVQYWNDIGGNIRGAWRQSDCKFVNIHVNYNDQKLMGSIASASLIIEVVMTAAYLQYQDLRDPTTRGIKHHNIFS
jgi:hypothetical protein